MAPKTYYVATNGNDSAAGTEAAPWKSIDKAFTATVLNPGDTVRIKPGNYKTIATTVTMTRGGNDTAGPITIKADDPDNKPVIYSPKTDAQMGQAVIMIQDCSYVDVEDLILREYIGGGLWVQAKNLKMTEVHIRRVDHIDTAWSSGHNMRIQSGFRKTNGYHPDVTFCTIEDCYLYQARPAKYPQLMTRSNGSTQLVMHGNEVITLIGEVRNCWVKNNRLVKCTNIGLNMIGIHTQKDKNTGAVRDDYQGMPANNIVSGNSVLWHYNVSGSGASIYMDRALGPNLIENNVVMSIKNGDQSGGTHAFYTNAEGQGDGIWDGWRLDRENWGRIIVRNNVFVSEIGVSGAGHQNDPKPSRWERWAHNVSIALSTSTLQHGPLLTRHVKELYVKNNVFLWRNQNGTQMIGSGNADPTAAMAATWSFDGNLWYGTKGPTVQKFQWGTAQYTGWAAYQAAKEPNGQWGNPVFVNENTRDYRLASGSPGYGDAIPLTYTNGAAAGGSSKTLYVDDAKWFCDGFQLQEGDRISVGGTNAVVAAVDYTNNKLTLVSAIDWDDNDPVYYAHTGTRSIGLQDKVSSGDAWTGDSSDPGDEPPPPPPPPPPPDPDPTPPTELLSNGDFSKNEWNAPECWYKYTAGTTTFDMSGGELDVAVTASGGNTQIYQRDLLIEEGESYTLEFDAVAASGSHTLDVVVQRHLSPYTNLGLDDVAVVTTTPTTFSYEFVATATEANSRLRISFPATGGNAITFDNFSLAKTTYPDDGGGGGGGGGGVSDSTSIAIAASGDDLDYRPSLSWPGTTVFTIRIGEDTYEYAALLRFILDKDVPDGSTIDSAYLDVLADQAPIGSGWSVNMSVVNASNPSMPGSQPAADALTLATSATAWTPASISNGTRYNTSDFADAMQTVLDAQGGFSNGDAIIIYMRDPGSVAGNRAIKIESYDGANNLGDMTRVAKLELAWTTPGGGSINPARTMNQTMEQTFNQTFGW